jgi:hypothetical protein
MSRIEGVSGSTRVRFSTGHDPAPAGEQPADPETTSRALIPLEAVVGAREAPATSQRPCAGFLAHLIATAGQLPQTREKRRAEPEDAVAAYQSTAKGAVPGALNLSRSM